MDLTPLEPRDGDVAVVHAARTSPSPSSADRFSVVEWGPFKIVSPRLEHLAHADAVLEARLCASERGRDAWDTTGDRVRRIPRLPLVYRGIGATYSISLDVTDYSNARAILQWQSTSHLTESQVREALERDGVSSELATALIGKAPMPEACGA